MQEIPTDLKYTSSHEWARLEDDGILTVGITHHAQDLLGDLVFIELPGRDTIVHAGQECVVIESVKAASDLFSPVSGEVVDINEDLVESPGLVNDDPYGDGWIVRIKPDNKKELNNLLSADDYEHQITAEK